MSHSRWNLPAPVPGGHAASTLGFSPLMAQLLANRGLSEPQQIQAFLSADAMPASDPFLLPDMSPAVSRILRAVLSGETIAVYGDFDVDGITATALMAQSLASFGVKVIPYIPHRLTEGYGLRNAALDSLRQQGASLVITVDCGISSANEVEHAQKLGLDIIITDHHAVPPAMPPALAIINPKRADSRYPFPDLAGVGVALKLCQALCQSLGKNLSEASGALALVALGSVADVVPLLGENRSLVRLGLQRLNSTPCLGLVEMMTQTGLSPGSLGTEEISWAIAPRLNAAGRLDHAMNSYKLLTTDSLEEARELVVWLEQKNTERQELTSEFFDRAKEQVQAKGILPILIVSGAEYPVGIAGLVASKLSEEYYRPAIVVRTGEKLSRGSCRSIPEFNIVQALNQCHELLSQFGGHSQAAGFTLPTENLPQLEQHLGQIAAGELSQADLRPRLDIDAVVNLSQLGGNTYQALQALSPFGCANPDPTFLSFNVEVLNCRIMGNSGGHLKLKLKQSKTVWDGVGFGLGNYLCEVASPIDIVYNLSVDRWDGQERLRLNILDFAPSS
ncbi:MAG: single-stranded-DNA-specific exonuclease RecJ [Chloroflexi bacterium]|nr:single-stranded-DNA-specific exonuclease RecJ [Chloroflexota bacterium]